MVAHTPLTSLPLASLSTLYCTFHSLAAFLGTLVITFPLVVEEAFHTPLSRTFPPSAFHLPSDSAFPSKNSFLPWMDSCPLKDSFPFLPPLGSSPHRQLLCYKLALAVSEAFQKDQTKARLLEECLLCYKDF